MDIETWIFQEHYGKDVLISVSEPDLNVFIWSLIPNSTTRIDW